MVKTSTNVASENLRKKKYDSPQIFKQTFSTTADIICSSGWDSRSNDRYSDDLDGWFVQSTVQDSIKE
ncbi:MAG: hypothetical protein ACI4SH_06970 [Candidatus Scatosoma sp.]